MSDYLVLTEFIPGTKAKAQDVNANFAAVKDAINSKASADGDSTKTFSVASATNANHAVRKEQLDELTEEMTKNFNATSARFCAKSGNTLNGNADLLSYSGMNVTVKVGGSYPNLIISNGNGEFSTISSLATISMSGKANGTYNVFVKSTGEAYVLANTIYKQINRPTMIDGDIWLETSVEPIKATKYNGTGDVEFLDVPVGKITVTNGTISSIETFQYNQNGYDVNAYSTKKYDSGWFAVSAGKINYTKTHNLGTSNIKYIVLLADDVNGLNQRPMDYFTVTESYGAIQCGATSTTLTIQSALHYVGFDASANGGITSGYFRILAEVI